MHLSLLLRIITLVVASLLIITILVQQRGTGLGQAFGGESTVYRTRRGAERFLFRLTIILAIIFVLIAIATILFS